MLEVAGLALLTLVNMAVILGGFVLYLFLAFLPLLLVAAGALWAFKPIYRALQEDHRAVRDEW